MNMTVLNMGALKRDKLAILMNKVAKLMNKNAIIEKSQTIEDESILNHYFNYNVSRDIKCERINNCWLLKESFSEVPIKNLKGDYSNCSGCKVYERLWY